MPARDIRLAFWPSSSMGMKARATLSGMVMIGMMADGMCHRNTRMTRETTNISSISLSLTVSMARSIRLERS